MLNFYKFFVLKNYETLTINFEPLFKILLISIDQPSLSIALLTIAKPNPVPLYFLLLLLSIQ